jgi:hypothetical protein
MMATLGFDIDDPRLAPTRGQTGPVTAARQRRTWIVYVTLVALGALPWVLGSAASWKAAGLGLWLPGAGFLALGSWWAALFPLILLLFVASLVAWFWAGAVVAPLTVWGGSALAAGLLAGGESWPAAPFVAGGVMVAIGTGFTYRNSRAAAAGRLKAVEREAFLPQSMAEVAAMSRAVPDPATRELSADQLAGLRYLLDRALQPIDRFDGFTILDQFQPASVRYQLNHMGFCLAVAQTAYLPNFRGYMGQAQRNLIEKYLLKRVWDYWVLESCWGHLNFTNWDPAARDNIMLTGWFGAHVGGYMLSSGDRRYLEPGSLSFRLNDKTVYPHDYRTIVGSVTSNFNSAEFGHYACEPNWIYPICNHYGMMAVATHDALLGTDHVDRTLPGWLEKLDTEFTDASGSIIALRSQHTGLPAIFPAGEEMYSHFTNIFAPARGRRLWAVARREVEAYIVDDGEGLRLKLPGSGLDIGNYKTGTHVWDYCTFLVAAREFGDARIADAALRSLQLEGDPTLTDGVLSYRKASNVANATIMMASFMDTGDFRRTFSEGVSPKTLAGPMIETVEYPAVLVARAWSDGTGLDAVFYPGREPGVRKIPLSQLIAGQRYAVTGAVESEITGNAEGRADISVDLRGRSEVRIRPIA